MTDNPQPPDANSPYTPVRPTSVPPPTPGGSYGLDPNAVAGMFGVSAPNSDMTPGRGRPMVAGPPKSVRGPIKAGGFNVGFAIAWLVGVILLVLVMVFTVNLIRNAFGI